MKKLSLSISVLFLIFFLLNISASAQNKILKLSKTTVIIPCPPGTPTPQGCENDGIIQVTTEIEKSVKNPQFEYSISGGKIDGKGGAVKWDLTGLRPGTYTISATVTGDDNFRQTISEQITVAQCSGCGGHCECPSLAITTSSKLVKAGKIVTLTAKVKGGTQIEINYNWTVSHGKIIAGQNTPSIKIQTKGLRGKEITVTLEIEGICEVCPQTATTVVKIK